MPRTYKKTNYGKYLQKFTIPWKSLVQHSYHINPEHAFFLPYTANDTNAYKFYVDVCNKQKDFR